jgi:hypothetical protein
VEGHAINEGATQREATASKGMSKSGPEATGPRKWRTD